MASDPELHDAGRLAGDTLAGTVRWIQQVHHVVADRTFGAIGTPAAPVRAAHDAVTRVVYGAVGQAHALVPRMVATTVLKTRGHPRDSDGAPAPWSNTPAGTRLLAALNGLRGDTLAERYPGLALTMSLRAHGKGAIELDPEYLAAGFAEASGRIVLFVHGLCESDESWWSTDGSLTSSYGEELSADLGFTPLYLRCNTGLSVDRNGRELSSLMERLVSGWPVSVEEVVLIGHSMGGLIARSACRHAHQRALAWADSVSHVISLGTPHRGAPLERGVDAAVKVMAKVPELGPLAGFLHDRSAGVKDLGEGLAVRDERGDLPGATYSSVAATLTRDSHHPLARTLGDLLVTYRSASGMGHPVRPDVNDRSAHLGRANHLDLLHHPAVSRQLHEWLAQPSR